MAPIALPLVCSISRNSVERSAAKAGLPARKRSQPFYLHCFSSLTHIEPGSGPGLTNASTTLASTREQLLSKLFVGNAGPNAADPAEKTAPLFGAVKYTISART
jgi:hypothetical protein